jgi:hypothetical protein
MSVSFQRLPARLLLLAVVGLYVMAWAGCHSAPPRPKETPQTQALRKAKRGD